MTPSGDGRQSIGEAMETPTNRGVTLGALSDQSAGALVVFLRHLGCTFCREALSDLAERREGLERAGVMIILVHMASDEAAGKRFAASGLDDVHRVSDPGKRLHRAFGLKRGSLAQLFGPRVWLRGIAATARGHLVGRLVGDGLQMPGVFLVRGGRIVSSYIHRTAADRPDYEAVACPPTPT